jgi:hypothetical protein
MTSCPCDILSKTGDIHVPDYSNKLNALRFI